MKNITPSPSASSNRIFLMCGSLFLALIFMAAFLTSLRNPTPAYTLGIGEEIAPAATPNATSVITIGVAADLSGPANWLGWRQVNAVQLAVNQINTAGGIDLGGTPYTLALVSADSGCINPTQAITAANDLLSAGVTAVVGHTCSVATNAVQSLYAAAGVPMVSASSSSPVITEQGYTTTFRVMSRDDALANRMANHLGSDLGFQKAAIVELAGFWGNGMTDVFSNTFSTLGGTITSRNTVASSADFTATLTTIMAENPDAIYFPHDNGSTAGLLSQIAHNLGMTQVPIAWANFTNNRDLLADYVGSAGAAAEGDIAGFSFATPSLMPGYDAFNTDYIAAGFANFGDEAQEWGAFAYDAAQIIIAAIDRADSSDPAAIRDQIAATTDYQGVVGFYEGFDANGDVIPQWAWLEQYQNGQWQLVLPYQVYLPVIIKP